MTEKKLHSLGNLVLAVLVLSAVSCQPARSPEPARPAAPRRGGTLHLWVPAADMLDPLFLDDVYEASVSVNLFNGLVALDDNLAVVPGLAEEWKVSRDGRIYDFQLRRGVRFHDGTLLDVEDVLFTFRRAMAVHSPVSVNEILQRLIDEEYSQGQRHFRIYALDASTVRIILRQPYPEFLRILAMDQLRVVPRKSFPPDRPKTAPPYIGTGPFVLDHQAADKIVLRRNEDYFAQPARIDKAEFMLVPELKPAQKVDLFRQGRLDVMEAFNIPQPEKVLSPNHWIVKAELSTSFVVFNCQRPPTDNVYFRRAFVTAFDRQNFFKKAYRGVEPTESILPPGMPGYLPVSDSFRRNPGDAALLLERSGLAPEKLPPLDILMATDDPNLIGCYRKVGDLLGIRIRIRHVADWSMYSRQMDQGEFHVTQLVWAADTPIPEQFYQSLLASSSSQNVARYRDDKIDNLIYRMYFEQNLNEKLTIIRTIESRVRDSVPYMPMENYILNFMIAPRVKDARMSPFGLLSLNLAELWIDEPGGRR